MGPNRLYETSGPFRTSGIALLRTTKAPAKAVAAAVHETPEYEEDQESHRWYEKNPWRSGFIGRGTSPRVTKDSIWVSVEELFDRKRPIEAKAWKAIKMPPDSSASR